MCMFCRSLVVLLYFFCWPLCWLSFFDIRILITSLSCLQTLLSIGFVLLNMWCVCIVFRSFLFPLPFSFWPLYCLSLFDLLLLVTPLVYCNISIEIPNVGSTRWAMKHSYLLHSSVKESTIIINLSPQVVLRRHNDFWKIYIIVLNHHHLNAVETSCLVNRCFEHFHILRTNNYVFSSNLAQIFQSDCWWERNHTA